MLYKHMLHIEGDLIIVHLMAWKLPVSPLLLNLTPLYRRLLSDHLSILPHLWPSCPTSPCIWAHSLSDHPLPRPTLAKPALLPTILVRLYCVLYDPLPAGTSSRPRWSWPHHVYRLRHSQLLLHWPSWPQLYRDYLRRWPDYISDWLLLCWPHAWPDNVTKLLLLLSDHYLSNISLAGLLNHMKLSVLLLLVLPHHLAWLHNLHHLRPSLSWGLSYCHKSLWLRSGSRGHVVLGP